MQVRSLNAGIQGSPGVPDKRAFHPRPLVDIPSLSGGPHTDTGWVEAPRWRHPSASFAVILTFLFHALNKMYSIFHAFSMEYRHIGTIAPMLKELGFTHVQFPPIQPTRVITLDNTDFLWKQLHLRDWQLESFGALCRTAREKTDRYSPHTFDHLLRQRIHYIRQPTFRFLHTLLLEKGLSIDGLLEYMYEHTEYGQVMAHFWEINPTTALPLEPPQMFTDPMEQELEQITHAYNQHVAEMKSAKGRVPASLKDAAGLLKVQQSRLLQKKKAYQSWLVLRNKLQLFALTSTSTSASASTPTPKRKPPFDLVKARRWLDCVTLLELVSHPPWWLIYQPVDLAIGNTILGSKQDILSALEACKRVGLEVISDVVINNLAAVAGEKSVWTPFLTKYGHGREQEPSSLADIVTEEDMNQPAIQITQRLLLDALGSDDLRLLTVPYDCSTAADPTQCWMSGALPQLQQELPLVRSKVDGFMSELRDVGISGIRIDAATHLKHHVCKRAVEAFTSGLSYIEYVGNSANTYMNAGLRLEDFGIGEDLYLNIFSDMADTERIKNYGGERLQRLGDLDSVVMIVNHDHIMGSLPSKIFSELPSHTTYVLSLAYLLQRVYGHVLLLPHDVECVQVQKALAFRRRMYTAGIVREYVRTLTRWHIEIEKYDNANRCLFVVYINLDSQILYTRFGQVEPFSIELFDVFPVNANIECVYSNTQNVWMHKYCYPRNARKRRQTRKTPRRPTRRQVPKQNSRAFSGPNGPIQQTSPGPSEA